MVLALSNGVLLTAIRVDLRRLHDGWMGLVFPRQLIATHNVLGRWRPQTLRGRFSYWSWYSLGAPIVAILYPLVLAGFATRFYARKIDKTAARLGMLGVVVLALVVWGALSAVAFVQLSTEGFIAVVAAAVVATISAALAVLFARVGGRGTTVLLGYPFAMNAIFLPPVVAALYSPMLARMVFPGSEQLAIWILDNVLWVGGVNAFLRAQYTLEGVAYAGMWFGIAVPVGWTLGILVTLADVVRPKERHQGDATGAGSADD